MNEQQLQLALKISHASHQQHQQPSLNTQITPQLLKKQQQSSFDQYFENLNNNPKFRNNIKTAKIYAEIVQNAMVYHIDQGQLKVSQQKKDVSPFLQLEKQATQQLRVHESRIKKQERERQFKYLHVWFKNKTEQPEEQVQPPNIFTQQQHKKLVKKFISQRRNQQKRYQQFVLQKKQRQKSLSEQKIKQQNQIQALQKLKKKQELLGKIKRQRQLHEDFVRNQHQSVQKLKLMKKNKFLYERIQDKYKSQILIPLLEQKKKQLKEIRQIRNFNINQIKEHERSYILKKSQHKIKILDHNKTEEFSYKPPHKTQRLALILEQEKMLHKFKQLQKKRLNQQNRLKQQSFVEDVKIKYKPKVDKKKQAEIQMRLLNQQSLQKKVKQPVDRIQVGLKYLQQVRKMKKKPRIINIQKGDLSMDQKNKSKSTSSYNEDKSFYSSSKLAVRHNIQQVKRNQIKKIINNQQVLFSDKMHILNVQNQRLNDLYKMKEKFLHHNQNYSVRQEAVDLLLSSIQAKIGLIEICQG